MNYTIVDYLVQSYGHTMKNNFMNLLFIEVIFKVHVLYYFILFNRVMGMAIFKGSCMDN